MKKLLIFPDVDTSPSLTPTPNSTCNELIWEDGVLIPYGDYDFSNLEFRCETLPSGKMTDFAVVDIGAPIVSEKTKNLFESLGLQMQYFPASVVESKSEKPMLGYYAVNIIGLVNCINFEESDLELEEEDGEIIDLNNVGTLKLKSESFGDIYRMYLRERVIIVEGEIAEQLAIANISGMKLMEPERWDGILNEKDE